MSIKVPLIVLISSTSLLVVLTVWAYYEVHILGNGNAPCPELAIILLYISAIGCLGSIGVLINKLIRER